ncbi:MAG: hypothetical protein MJ252_22715, partial [archaeon]|nr:hypothetical protein [archaeon]
MVTLYKKDIMDIDTYIFHYNLTEWYQALIIRSLRRVLRDTYKINIPLIDTYNQIKEKYKSTADFIINDIKNNNKYLGKSIIPIEESYVVVEEEGAEEAEEEKKEEKKDDK